LPYEVAATLGVYQSPNWSQPKTETSYNVTYSYDAGVNMKGRRTGMSDASGSTSWEYDVRGRVVAEHKATNGWLVISPIPANRRWVYDSMDRPSELIVNEADGFYNQYDAAGRLQQVHRLGGETVTLSYNALGQVTERRLGYQSGIPYPELRQIFTYSSSDNFRLTNLHSGYNGPNYNNLQNISYTYDDTGNVLTIADSAAYGGSQTQTFTYDALNRILTAQAPDGNNGAYSQRSYSYNKAGNVTAFEGTALHYLDTAHRHPITHVGGTALANKKYWYDVNGNATRRISGSQDISLTYDTENRLTGIVGNGINASYIYDGDGKLVKSVVNGLTSFYPYPELEVIETAPGVFREKYYMTVDGVRLSMQDRSAWPPVKNYWLLGDHLGSTAITVDGTAGNRVTELRYYPYGRARYDAGSQLTNYWFTGQRREAGTGLYFYQSRWYDPVVGRFLSADTIVPAPGNPQALNRYSYVLCNPMGPVQG